MEENKLYCNILTSKGFDGHRLILNAPKFAKMKTQAVTKPQSEDHIEAISNEKAAGQSFHVTIGEYTKFDYYFKSWLLLESTACIKKLEAQKVRIQERIQIQIDKDNVTRPKVPLIEESKSNVCCCIDKAIIKVEIGWEWSWY